MVPSELPTDAEDPRHHSGPRGAQIPNREEDPEPKIPVAPVFREKLVAVARRPLPLRVVSAPAVRPVLTHKSAAQHDVEVVPGFSDANPEAAGDRSEVVTRKDQEVIVDPYPSRMVKARGSRIPEGERGQESQGDSGREKAAGRGVREHPYRARGGQIQTCGYREGTT